MRIIGDYRLRLIPYLTEAPISVLLVSMKLPLYLGRQRLKLSRLNVRVAFVSFRSMFNNSLFG